MSIKRLSRNLLVMGAVAASLGFAPPGPVSAVVIAEPGARTALETRAGGSPAGVTRTVTLITGDRVSVTTRPDGAREVRTIPGPGRGRQSFAEYEANGRLTVLPADAARLVAAGRLDPRLFDVSTLLEQRLDDGSRSEHRVIVTYVEPARARAVLRSTGVRVDRELPSIGGTAVRVPKATSGTFWSELTEAGPGARSAAAGVRKIWLDGIRKPLLDQSTRQIGAPAAWQAGLTGKGVTVAVLDTGVDPAHPDLVGRVAEAKDFTGEGPGDLDGHGTHVASTIAGTGAASAGVYRGVASEARLVDGKVCGLAACPESAIIAGMQWAAVDQKARVVNLSLGAPDTTGLDPLEEAVNSLTASTGALFVIAAGNSGPHDQTVSSPGSADAALTVGAVDRADELATFSSRGPRLGDHAIKPDLTAPGVGIVAARAKDSTLGEPVGDRYQRLSGTSMATPHVVGAAALLVQRHPEWDAAAVKAALMGSADASKAAAVFQHGAGRVDLTRAIHQQVLAARPSLSLGAVPWPHDDDQPVTAELGYRNTGTAAVDLDLTVAGVDPAGQPAPQGAFTVSPARITVPAGGTAQATVTANTRHGGPDGGYSARVVARQAGTGEVAVGTPVGIVKEVESHDLSVDLIDRNGARRGPNRFVVTDMTSGRVQLLDFRGQSTRLRLPAGTYDVIAPIWTWASDEVPTSLTMAARPELRLDRDVTLSLDARKGQAVRAAVDDRDARPHLRRARLIQPHFRASIGTDLPDFGIFATPTARVTSYPYAFRFEGSLAEPASAARAGRPARGYSLFQTERGRIPDPPVFRVRDGELATVRTMVHGQGDPQKMAGELITWPFGPDDEGQWLSPISLPVTAPAVRFDRYSTGVRWTDKTMLTEGPYEGGRDAVYQPGRRYAEHYNRGVVGPAASAFADAGTVYPGLALYSGSDPGHLGHGPLDPASGIAVRTTLTRDGELVGVNDDTQGGQFDVPAGRATYTLTTEATRGVSWAGHATSLRAKWTFATSVEPGDSMDLPLLNLRIKGDFDLLNRVRASRPGTLRLTAEQVRKAVPITGAAVSVSFDDGTSWRSLVPRRDGDAFVVSVPKPPAGAEFVSLRASAWRSDGARVDQTVIRAHGLRR